MAAPGLGDYFRQCGVIPASRQGVSAALGSGCDVIIRPGGDVDAMRNWRRRDQAVLGGRKGFLRQAIRSGVPIVPVASVGGHDTVFVLSEGRWIANGLDRISGLKKKLRGTQLPIVLGIPFGVTIETIPTHLPLPAKIRTAARPDSRRQGPRAGQRSRVRQLDLPRSAIRDPERNGSTRQATALPDLRLVLVQRLLSLSRRASRLLSIPGASRAPAWLHRISAASGSGLPRRERSGPTLGQRAGDRRRARRQSGLCQVLASGQTGSTARP